jgi:glyoxylase-like metal-dependent hydrolase (beta-lactamase superfamily II)
MSGLQLPEKDIAPLDHISDGVAGLRILLVNVYAIQGETGWTLIDAGLYLSAGKIRSWAKGLFGDMAPESIVLTHGHFDHVGSLQDLAQSWDVPVYVHPLESPYVTGQSKYPQPDASAGGGLMSVLAPFYPRGPVDIGTRALRLPPDGRVPNLPEWRWIHTPGHTEGHISLFRESDRTLVAGDAFCTTKQESVTAIMTQKPELHGPPAYYTSDWDAAEQSVKKLAALQPFTIAAGHGLPMQGQDISPTLQTLAAHFNTLARPRDARKKVA